METEIAKSKLWETAKDKQPSFFSQKISWRKRKKMEGEYIKGLKRERNQLQ